MIPLAGYADRLSVRPGETINFHVASTTETPVTASVVRVISADPNPAGHGIRIVDIADAKVTQIRPPRRAEVPLGSYATVHMGDHLRERSDFTLIVNIFVTRPGPREQGIFSCFDAVTASGVALILTSDGKLGFSVGHGDGRTESVTCDGIELPQQTWMTVALVHSVDEQSINIFVRGSNSEIFSTCETVLAAPLLPSVTTQLFVASVSGDAGRCFNGRIERPIIFDRALSPDEISRVARGDTVQGLIAAWDFSRDMHSSRVVDTGPHGLHGTLVNCPTRAVRGSTWTGREQCYRHAPDQYSAIHFHDDDVDDCRWPPTHAFTVPTDFKSGAYALMLKAGDVDENIPFFVVPAKGTQSAKLAVLVSTFTYTIYGNHARPEWSSDPQWRAAWIEQTRQWNGYAHNPSAHPEYGLSTYNYHTDSSGIAIASWHRPMFNLRIGYVTYPYPDIRASGLRHYPADQHLLSWLEAKGHEYDLITDWELHHEGVALLARYTCVMTGSHPEYHTGEMLDALEAYRDGGGRLMYLGGNGFYWKIALSPEKPGVIEIRRAEGGIRAWAAEPGEYYNQFDGEYGGLWRRNGRPPQKLVGVGFTAQGNFVGSHYRIKPDALSDPRTAWMFEGITDATIGGFGFSGHGAAGFELDRADKRLGTPANALVVAQSENHPPEAPWVLVPEEQLTHLTTIPGESHKQLIRADMTIFATPNNGAVFSTGSITFCGSLPYNNFENSISTLLDNVLRRFLDRDAIVAQ